MNNDSLTTAGLATGFTIVAGIIYKAINHKRIRSDCCGKKMVASIDIEETTPPQLHGFPKDHQSSITKEQIEQLHETLKQLQKLQQSQEAQQKNTIENPMRPYLNTRTIEKIV